MIDELLERFLRQKDGGRPRILFWSTLKGERPQDFIRTDIPSKYRYRVAELLASGERHISYLGYACCRICGELLGTSDVTGYGFVWPEKAEHYITEHDVWTPGCAALLRAAGGSK
jgi:hypothetical protein